MGTHVKSAFYNSNQLMLVGETLELRKDGFNDVGESWWKRYEIYVDVLAQIFEASRKH